MKGNLQEMMYQKDLYYAMDKNKRTCRSSSSSILLSTSEWAVFTLRKSDTATFILYDVLILLLKSFKICSIKRESTSLPLILMANLLNISSTFNFPYNGSTFIKFFEYEKIDDGACRNVTFSSASF